MSVVQKHAEDIKRGDRVDILGTGDFLEVSTSEQAVVHSGLWYLRLEGETSASLWVTKSNGFSVEVPDRVYPVGTILVTRGEGIAIRAESGWHWIHCHVDPPSLMSVPFDDAKVADWEEQGDLTIWNDGS